MNLKALEFELENGEMLRLTPKEAKELYDQLKEFYGEPQKITINPSPLEPYTNPRPAPMPMWPDSTWCGGYDSTRVT